MPGVYSMGVRGSIFVYCFRGWIFLCKGNFNACDRSFTLYFTFIFGCVGPCTKFVVLTTSERQDVIGWTELRNICCFGIRPDNHVSKHQLYGIERHQSVKAWV